MAYLEQTVTTFSLIPDAMLAFAEARGWTRAGAKITRPGGGIGFTIATKPPRGNSKTVLEVLGDNGKSCWTSSPQDNAAGNGNPYAPTKVHCFGNDSPWDEEGKVAPWLAFVIEFGYNRYRHVYIGNMVKLGDYTGGECISANFWGQYAHVNAGSVTYNDSLHRYLFSAMTRPSRGEGDDKAPMNSGSGGVQLLHADNPNTWRDFTIDANGSNDVMRDLNGQDVFGGIQDGINAAMQCVGFADYAGAAALIPVNLFGSEPGLAGTQNYRIRPFGFPAGARMINMKNLNPGEQFLIGNRAYRAFPEFKRSQITTFTRTAGATQSGWSDEGSLMAGYAYPETDE